MKSTEEQVIEDFKEAVKKLPMKKLEVAFTQTYNVLCGTSMFRECMFRMREYCLAETRLRGCIMYRMKQLRLSEAETHESNRENQT